MAASSVPGQFHSDYSTLYSHEYLGLQFPRTCADSSIVETPHLFDYTAAINTMMPFMVAGSDINSPVSDASFPVQFGVPDCMAISGLSEWEMGGGLCDFAGGIYKNQVFGDPREDNSSGPSLMETNGPSNCHIIAADNWATQGKQVANVEESKVKVCRYSVEERKERILRYLKKRNKRNFNKTIKYACRKTLADKRVRVRGRFAKNNEPAEDDNVMKTTVDCYQQSNDSFFDDSMQAYNLLNMIYKDEDWFQKAMDGIVYLRYG